MKKVNIGLDIGIASVGWAIVDAEEFGIIDAGSRLFKEANDSNIGASASIRREYRGRRRNLRRDELRREELKKLFVDKGWIKEEKDFEMIQPTKKNIYQLRLEALNEAKQPNELMLIFSNFIKHRGVFNLKDEAIEDAKKKKQDDAKASEKELKDFDDEKLWACEVQLQNLKTKGVVKGSHNKLPHEKYRKELVKILETQKSFNLIDDAFSEKILQLFDRRRQYFEGPGKNSKYGWDGDQEVFYQQLLGFDTYNPQEVRAPKAGMYANLYNLLNDLNNLTIKNDFREESKLTRTEKELIIGSIFDTNGKPANLTLPRLAKLLKVKPEDINGYRIDKKNKAEFTNFELVNKIHSALENIHVKAAWLTLNHCDLLDELSLIMTQGQSYDYRREKIEQCLSGNNVKDAPLIAQELAYISLSGSHHLSNQTIKSLLKEMWEKPHSAQQIFAERQLRPQYHFKINANTKYIPVAIEEIQNMYISPVAKRSFIQALKVLKQIQRFCEGKYGIAGVYIELAREKNSDDQKDFLKLQQRNNETLNQEIRKLTSIEDPTTSLSKKTLKKLRLAMEQGFKCAYCFRDWTWYEVKDQPSLTEIDHIIPESISFSSNSDNLVLVCAEENHAKGKATPFKYFHSQATKLNWNTWERKVITKLYKKYLETNKNSRKYIGRKLEHLLDETDFDNPENVQGFLERNLNDTRISTKYLKEYLEECRRLQNFDFKIKTINGQFTDYIKRRFFDLPPKNRDFFQHHAIDAIAIAYSDFVRNRKIAPHEWSIHKTEILNHDFRFSVMQNHNFNKQFTDETLYSFRKNEAGDYVKIQKIDIFTAEPSKITKLDQLLTQDSNKVLMAQADPFTFQHLQQIWKECPIGMQYFEDEREKRIKNPFLYYRDVLGKEIIKLQNKKGPEDPNLNPPIKMLRYQDTKIGKHLNVTHKYPLTKENKIVAFESFKPIRLDFYKNRHTDSIRMLMVNITDIKRIDDDRITIHQKNYASHKKNVRIGEDYELFCKIFPGDTISFQRGNKNHLAIAIGGTDKSNSLEIKHLHRNKIKKATMENQKIDKHQIFIPLSQVSNITKKNSDILGIKSSEYMLEFN